MKIDGRKKKIESDKLVQVLKMYNIFLEYGSVYDFELGLDCSTERDQTTFRRYANELIRIGAIPKIRLNKKTIEDGLNKKTFYFYSAPDVKLVKQKPFKKEYNALSGGYLPVYDSKQAFQKNPYNHFKTNRKKGKGRLARLVCYQYWISSYPVRDEQDLRSRYERINPGASEKTYQRDHDLLLIARFSYLDYDPKEDRENLPDVYLRYIEQKSE